MRRSWVEREKQMKWNKVKKQKKSARYLRAIHHLVSYSLSLSLSFLYRCVALWCPIRDVHCIFEFVSFSPLLDASPIWSCHGMFYPRCSPRTMRSFGIIYTGLLFCHILRSKYATRWNDSPPYLTYIQYIHTYKIVQYACGLCCAVHRRNEPSDLYGGEVCRDTDWEHIWRAHISTFFFFFLLFWDLACYIIMLMENGFLISRNQFLMISTFFLCFSRGDSCGSYLNDLFEILGSKSKFWR